MDAKIETLEDRDQVFLNAKRATELPGVDFSKLTPEQKKAVPRQFNEQMCTCGCRLTLAQCRINDSICPVSLKLAAHLDAKVARGEPTSQEVRLYALHNLSNQQLHCGRTTRPCLRPGRIFGPLFRL